jgi:hypothetical protein
MRKITAGLFITLDGVIEAPEKWNPPYYNDEMTQVVMGQMAADAFAYSSRIRMSVISTSRDIAR